MRNRRDNKIPLSIYSRSSPSGPGIIPLSVSMLCTAPRLVPERDALNLLDPEVQHVIRAPVLDAQDIIYAPSTK